MANDTNMIKRLPAIFQTVTERKFFDATFDQVFSKRNAERITGFIGRQNSGEFDPINDFYLPEPNKDRTRYHLEPTVVSKDTDTLEKTNHFFYTDMVNRIRFYGGNTDNHDRLFNSSYYSYAPPIDIDKYTNFQNYYWIADKLEVIDITGMTDADVDMFIIGQQEFNTTQLPGASPQNVEFSNGQRVRFIGTTNYDEPLTVENIGISIMLVPDYLELISVKKFTLLPWAGKLDIQEINVLLDNEEWDVQPWDATSIEVASPDYITIGRGSINQNAWSRSNKWYHIDVILQSTFHNNIAFPDNTVRATRPIIEFFRDTELYNSGTQFLSNVEYYMKTRDFNNPLDCLSGYTDSNGGFQEVLYSDVQGQALGVVKTIPVLSNIAVGELIVFPCDPTTNDIIWKVNIDSNNIIDLTVEYAPTDNDIILITGGSNLLDSPLNGHKGISYYYNVNQWQVVANQKVKENQPPLFNLYDSENVELHNDAVYPNNNFRGSEIFSYKVNDEVGTSPDPVLGFPLEYKNLGQLADIIFENDLQTERYDYIIDGVVYPITGQYFYRNYLTSDDVTKPEEWTYSNSWYPGELRSEQRVIDPIVAFDPSVTDFTISVAPLNNSVDNMEVHINGEKTPYFSFSYKNGLPTISLFNSAAKLEQNDSIEVYTYTYDPLPEDSRGYFEIPQQLEANPLNEEVTEQSFGEFTPHFGSIIENQDGAIGDGLGRNNYRDTARDPSVGTHILQNESSLIKTMLVSSEDDLDVVRATRFAQNAYTTFKAKYLKIARQLDVRGFSPTLTAGDLTIDMWVEEILNMLTVSKEFSESFAYSYMIARGEVIRVDTTIIPNFTQPITYQIDLTDPKNSLYLYKITTDSGLIDSEVLLLADVDYIVEDNFGTTKITYVDTNKLNAFDTVLAKMYEDPVPAYMPATPAKLGMAPVFRPEITVRETFSTPTFVIVGHDGSEVPTFGEYNIQLYLATGAVVPASLESGDIRDELLLELETRVYNDIQQRFREEYNTLLGMVDIRPGGFRQYDGSINNTNPFIETADNRYLRHDYNDITESFYYRWTAENKADYKLNEFYDPSDWKTWNYSTQNDQNTGATLTGHWQGIFRWYYDTIRPDTHPWEMLGFTIKPDWWETTTDTGDGFTGYGTNTGTSNTQLWTDLANGQIRRGARKGIDTRYARLYLGFYYPVDGGGNIRSIVDIFNLPVSSWVNQDAEWKYGDGSPVEQAWYNSSEYRFSTVEFFYLMRPSEFGEKFWDPSSEGFANGQLIDLETRDRAKPSDAIVHGEKTDDSVTYKTGYQQYISDRLLFLGKNVTPVFGDKVRNLTVNLGHQMAAFTNQDTIRLALQSSSTESLTGNLIIPTTNYQVYLHTSSSVKDYVYSGVIIRTNDDGSFTIYGYDLLDQVFHVLPASPTSRRQQVHQGGTPVDFKIFTFDEEYYAGDVVKYNTHYYQAKKTHTAETFMPTMWTKLAKLPETGGVAVTYYQDRIDTPELVPYGIHLKSTQDVYDFLIGYGAWLEQDGWKFDTVNNLNQIMNWKTAGEQFLFWVTNNWAPDNALFLSPNADGITLEIETGYPDNVERLTNGVYSILDKRGISIHPRDTLINRDDKLIQVVPKNLNTGVYYLRVSAKETEHILIVDNTTEFNDIVYQPLLRVRQDRLTFTGTRTLDWFGKLQAGGFLIQEDSLVQNFENITDSFREFYNTETALDNPDIDDGTKHLIGYENREFLDELKISDDVQFNFYQGFIRQKGTPNAIDKLLRSDEIQNKERIEYFEEWAIKLGDFGGTDEQVTTEFLSKFKDVKGDPQTYRLNFIPDTAGSVGEVVLFNAEEQYEITPRIRFDNTDVFMSQEDAGEAGILIKEAEAIATLGIDKRISGIEITNPGSGYIAAPIVIIEPAFNVDTGVAELSVTSRSTQYAIDSIIGDVAFATFQPNIKQDNAFDTIIDIDIDDTDVWLMPPVEPTAANMMPLTDKSWLDFNLPNAGYVHTNDICLQAFDVDMLFDVYENALTQHPPAGSANDAAGKTVWVANNKQRTWGVYEAVEIDAAAAELRAGGTEIDCIADLNDIVKSARVLFPTNKEVCDIVETIDVTKKNIIKINDDIVEATEEKDSLDILEQTVLLNRDSAEGSVAFQQELLEEAIINSSTKDLFNYTLSPLGKEFTDINDRVERYQALMVEYAAVKEALEHAKTVSPATEVDVRVLTDVEDGNHYVRIEAGNASVLAAQVSSLTSQLGALRAKLDAKADELIPDGVEGEIEKAVRIYKEEMDLILAGDDNRIKPEKDPDYEKAKDKIINILLDYNNALTNVRNKNEALRDIREGQYQIQSSGPDIGLAELLEDGQRQVTNELVDLNQELVAEERILEQQQDQLKQTVEDLADDTSTDLDTLFDEDLSLIDIDSAKFNKATTRLEKFRRYLETTFTSEGTDDTSDDIILEGLISITLYALDENNNLTDEVVLNRVYRYSRLEDETEAGTGVIYYYLQDKDKNAIKYSEEFGIYTEQVMSTVVFEFFINLRFKTLSERTDSGITSDTYTWVDNYASADVNAAYKNNNWVVEKINADDSTKPHRMQEKLINTKLFENAYLRDNTTGDTIRRLPVYDPFKDLISGRAEQNIDYKHADDPFKYTHSNNPAMINVDLANGDSEVGKVWWDMSTIKFVYYEQPTEYSLRYDSTERTKSLNYRRDNWGKIFPGATADIYEWTRSYNPPSEYDGSGTPRNTTDYVLINKLNNLTDMETIYYYFWVKNSIERPTHLPNRTLATSEVSRLISNPRSLQYEWFAPLQGTEESASYAFANVNHVLSNNNTVLQVNYALREDANLDQSQWQLLREGDRFSLITDEMWDKMIDSLVGHTVPLPLDDYPQGLQISDDEVVLPVPALGISEAIKYGTKIRPQQSMFVDILAARKVMVQKINALTADIKMWSNRFLNWDQDIRSQTYWEYVDWYEIGYNASSTVAKRQVQDTGALESLTDLRDKELIKVYPFVPDNDDRYEIYEYQLTENDFYLVRREKGTMQFLDTAYTAVNFVILRYELRAVLDALRDSVFIDEYVINENLTYFALLNFSFSEGETIDWAFKTTYISFLQDDVLLDQRPSYQADFLDEFIKYVKEAKPYHTKIRSTNTSIATDVENGDDIGCGTGFDDAIGTCITTDVNGDPVDTSWGPVPITPFPDPVNNGSILSASWEWDSDCIGINLRLFKFAMDIGRVWCSQEEKDAYEAELGSELTYPNYVERCDGRLIIDASQFTLGWDTTPWDPIAYLLGYDEFTGIPNTHTQTGSNSWTPDFKDSLLFVVAWDAIKIDRVIGNLMFNETANLIIDATYFRDADDIPEEMVLISPNESIVIDTNYRVYNDSSEPPHTGIVVDESEMYDMSFKMNINPMGWIEYVHKDPTYSTTLTADVLFGDTRISVADATILPVSSKTYPGVVWINSERIEYNNKDGNDLIGIIRGTLGTAIQEHTAGDVVNDGSEDRYVVEPDDITVHASMRTTLPDNEETPITDPWFTTPLDGADTKVLTGDANNINLTPPAGDVILIVKVPPGYDCNALQETVLTVPDLWNYAVFSDNKATPPYLNTSTGFDESGQGHSFGLEGGGGTQVRFYSDVATPGACPAEMRFMRVEASIYHPIDVIPATDVAYQLNGNITVGAVLRHYADNGAASPILTVGKFRQGAHAWRMNADGTTYFQDKDSNTYPCDLVVPLNEWFYSEFTYHTVTGEYTARLNDQTSTGTMTATYPSYPNSNHYSAGVYVSITNYNDVGYNVRWDYRSGWSVEGTGAGAEGYAEYLRSVPGYTAP